MCSIIFNYQLLLPIHIIMFTINQFNEIYFEYPSTNTKLIKKILYILTF